jgi:putative pyrroloquinoline-quinone binding quinoprotein
MSRPDVPLAYGRRQARGEPPPGASGAARRRQAAVVAVIAAVAAVAAVVTAVLLIGGHARRPPAAPGPRVVADVVVGDALGAVARPAFGSMWLSDSSRGEIVRVDLRTRKVTRRNAIGSEAAVETAAGAVWALPRGPGYQGGPLFKIGPSTGRTIARIPLRTPAGGPFRGGSIVVAPGRVWVLGATGAVAIDPAVDRVVAAIRLGGAFTVTDGLVRGDELWLTRGDRSVTRFDARTGRRLGRLPWRSDGFLVPFADRLVAVMKEAVALVDPLTGRATWRRPLGTDLHDAAVTGARLFVVGGDGPVGTRDRIWELDARTGRVVGALTMPEFGPEGMVAVGRGVWLLTAGGRAVVVEP